MTLTILFDLDDTLIKNSNEVFIPAFLKEFSDHLGHHSEESEKIIPRLMASTQKMMQNNDPSLRLKEIFDADFYPAMNWNYEQALPLIEDFYQNTYPNLRELTAPFSGCRSVVSQMLERGYQIAVATNPIFPQDAVQLRLDWAGLSEEKTAFSLVTSYEEMHFAKPNLAYYTEILSLIGWPDTPIVMVGDDKSADIDPSQELGLATFWISDSDDYAQNSKESPFGIGSLGDVIPWIDSLPEDRLVPDLNSLATSLAIHRSTPAALDTILANLPPETWQFYPPDDEWSLTEICCHLRDVDREIYIPRVQEVMQSERPFLEAIDADAWAETRGYKGQDGQQAFRNFISARVELLEIIDGLPQEAWEKEIRHTIFGPISLAEILRISARHDKLHIQQICKLLSNSAS
jgi:FMN phosphatase YigB (HAD superfamily)